MSGTDEKTAAEERRAGHIRSFVLRQGRISDAQRRFHEQGMPRWGIPYQAGPLDLDAVFGRRAHRKMCIRDRYVCTQQR